MGSSNPLRVVRPRSAHHERSLLHKALLTATAALVREQDPQAAVQRACEALVAASPHVRMAWIALRQSDLPIRALYSSSSAPAALAEAHSAEEMVAALDRSQGPQGDEQFVCIPFSDRNAELRGVVGVFADQADYFERVELDPFYVFADVCSALLKQAVLRQRLKALAEYDELTGLINRAAMRPILEHVHAHAKRDGQAYAVILFDLDQFKSVNDQYGHAVGDRVLAETAARARAALREGDWLARWGGEEFLALLPGAEADEALAVADRVRTEVGRAPFVQDSFSCKLNLSGGVAAFPLDGSALEELISVADAALYEAKDSGRNRVQRPSRRGRRVYALAGQIEEALRTGRLVPAYQPIVELAGGRVVGQEVLARLVRAEGVLDASEFIEIANLRHLVHQIDFQIFSRAVLHCRAQVENEEPGLLHFVNVSAGLLRRPDLIEALASNVKAAQDACMGRNVEQHPLVIEITERDFLDTREARRMLAPFVEMGVRLAIDDFGSGYSSFQYLADLPVDFLKIEGGLVRQAKHSKRGRAILRGIQDIARELGLTTLAEGVEKSDTAQMLREVGIDWVQGYYFGRPALEPDPPAASAAGR